MAENMKSAEMRTPAKQLSPEARKQARPLARDVWKKSVEIIKGEITGIADIPEGEYSQVTINRIELTLPQYGTRNQELIIKRTRREGQTEKDYDIFAFFKDDGGYVIKDTRTFTFIEGSKCMDCAIESHEADKNDLRDLLETLSKARLRTRKPIAA